MGERQAPNIRRMGSLRTQQSYPPPDGKDPSRDHERGECRLPACRHARPDDHENDDFFIDAKGGDADVDAQYWSAVTLRDGRRKPDVEERYLNRLHVKGPSKYIFWAIVLVVCLPTLPCSLLSFYWMSKYRKARRSQWRAQGGRNYDTFTFWALSTGLLFLGVLFVAVMICLLVWDPLGTTPLEPKKIPRGTGLGPNTLGVNKVMSESVGLDNMTSMKDFLAWGNETGLLQLQSPN